jgi:signal transduction histidine kinase
MDVMADDPDARIAELEAELRQARAVHAAEVASLREEQTATAEILRVITSSSSEPGGVLQAITDAAVRLCGSMAAAISQVDGDAYVLVADTGLSLDMGVERQGWRRPLNARTTSAEAIRAARTVHTRDARDPDHLAHYPDTPLGQQRTSLHIPLRHDGKVIGVLSAFRGEVLPYTPAEISILETFADQAVIAIENARLFEQLQKANQRLGEANEQIAEASQHKSQFLANMSHELRTPLNAIIGYSEMLQEEAEDVGEEAFIPDLQKVNAAGKHLLGLINDILDLSKIEAGRMDLYLETFEIEGLARDVQAIIQPLMNKNANRLVVECPGDLGEMRADLTKVRQTLFNLLSNAAKFTDHGTITLTVQRESEDWLRFAVADTGIGMTEEQLSRLFEAFSQAEASTRSQYGGTGLGLAISRAFCHMMGGDLTVECVYGQGSTFTVRLPTRVSASASATPDEAPSQG